MLMGLEKNIKILWKGGKEEKSEFLNKKTDKIIPKSKRKIKLLYFDSVINDDYKMPRL